MEQTIFPVILDTAPVEVTDGLIDDQQFTLPAIQELESTPDEESP